MLTTVILLPGVGNPGSVLGVLTPFPGNPLDPLDTLDPVESSQGLQKRYEIDRKWTLCSEKGSNFSLNR